MSERTEQRLARLERSNRLWACATLGLLCVLGAMGLAGGDEDEPRELTLDRLVIGDREGVPRMVLTQTDASATLTIEHPEAGEPPLTVLGANRAGGSLSIGYTMLQGRHDGTAQVFQMGHWIMDDQRLTLGPRDEPALMLGHDDGLGFVQLADHEGRIRAELRILEPWDAPGSTSGYLHLHSPGDTLTLRVKQDPPPAEAGDE